MFHPPSRQELSLGDHPGWDVTSTFLCGTWRLLCSVPSQGSWCYSPMQHSGMWESTSGFGAFPAELAEIGANISFYQKVVVETFSLSLRNLHSYHGFVV